MVVCNIVGEGGGGNGRVPIYECRGCSSLARLVSLAQIGELARRL